MEYCYLRQTKEAQGSLRFNLKTKCLNWMDSDLFWENETVENQDDLVSNLLSGNVDYYSTLSKRGD